MSKLPDRTKVLVNVVTAYRSRRPSTQAIDFIVENGNDCSETLKNAVNAMTQIESLANDLTLAIQNEYRARQQNNQQGL